VCERDRQRESGFFGECEGGERECEGSSSAKGGRRPGAREVDREKIQVYNVDLWQLNSYAKQKEKYIVKPILRSVDIYIWPYTLCELIHRGGRFDFKANGCCVCNTILT
jgi:hypothetical protein